MLPIDSSEMTLCHSIPPDREADEGRGRGGDRRLGQGIDRRGGLTRCLPACSSANAHASGLAFGREGSSTSSSSSCSSTTSSRSSSSSSSSSSFSSSSSSSSRSEAWHCGSGARRRSLELSWTRVAQSAVVVAFVAACCAATFALGSVGDVDPAFRSCVDKCVMTGCVGAHCIPGCQPLDPATFVHVAEDAAAAAAAAEAATVARASNRTVTAPWALLALRWDCVSECRYQCMHHIVSNRPARTPPVKYFGKWPFTRVLGAQEPASVVFSVLNLGATLWGVGSFVRLVFFRLPRKPMGDRGPYYEYAGLFTLYGVMAANSWLWSAVFHARDTVETERLDYFSAIALLGFTLMLAVIRTASLRVEAARVMVAAPIIAFVTTHIFYLQFYQFDYGWNMMVCTVMGVAQLLLWMVWAALVRHPAALKLWLSTGGAALAMLLELYDFPPLRVAGPVEVDAHALWHAATVPLTLLWWSFACDDAQVRTLALASRVGGRLGASGAGYRPSQVKKMD